MFYRICRSQPYSLVGNIPLVSGQQEDGNCAALRKQNKLLRQMLLSVAGEDGGQLPSLGTAGNPRNLLLAATSNPAQDLLERAVGGGAISSGGGGVKLNNNEFVTSVLVTPTAEWQTSETTTSYVTTVTETASTEVPIILRGKKIITTILNEEVKTVTLTETQTSSTLITPTPTWSSFVITQTASIDLLAHTFGNIETEPKALTEDNRPKRRNNQPVIQAEVIEIDETTTPRASKLDRFREAYGSYFASSAQRSAQRFGDSFKRISGSGNEGDDLDIFDQQVQPANNRPVYVPSPSHKEFTLFFSGKNPGEFTTKVTVLPVDQDGKPVRSKREAIEPSRVEPIQTTSPPEKGFDDISNPGNVDLEDSLQGSIEPCGHSGPLVTTVTVTETLVVTKSEV